MRIKPECNACQDKVDMMPWAVLGVSCDTQGEILMHDSRNRERNGKEDKPTAPDLQKHRGRPQLLQNLVFFFRPCFLLAWTVFVHAVVITLKRAVETASDGSFLGMNS